MLERVTRFLSQSIPIEPLVTLRVTFGLLMCVSTLRFIAFGWVDQHFVDAAFHFKYYGFEWVQYYSAWSIWTVHMLMVISSLCMALGLCYRVSAATFAVCFTYTQLIDLTYYLNHYYFISLVSILLVFVPAHRAYSFDIRIWPRIRRTHIPWWVVGIFMLQAGIVYTYAGLAKINYEWLIKAMPLRLWLPANDDLPLIGWTFRYPITAYLFSWAGMLYDTFIVWFLLWKRTRILAYFAVVAFHLMTGLLFQIGMFPYIMIGLTLIFFSPKWHQALWKRVGGMGGSHLGQGSETLSWQVLPPWKPLLKVVVGTYFVFQLIFPWRYLIYDGNMFWHEQGYRFGWRVMLMEKAGSATFYVKDSLTEREGVVDNREFLNPHQEKQMSMQPDMILQYAQFLKQHYQEKGVTDPQVRAEVYVSYNGRLSKLLFPDTLELTQINDSWEDKDWLYPLEE